MLAAQRGEEVPLVRAEGLPRKLKAIKPGKKRVKQSWRRNLAKAGAFAMPEMRDRDEPCNAFLSIREMLANVSRRNAIA
jgi:hypothetical protein